MDKVMYMLCITHAATALHTFELDLPYSEVQVGANSLISDNQKVKLCSYMLDRHRQHQHNTGHSYMLLNNSSSPVT